jgi:hypothetical protein
MLCSARVCTCMHCGHARRQSVLRAAQVGGGPITAAEKAALLQVAAHAHVPPFTPAESQTTPATDSIQILACRLHLTNVYTVANR